MALLDSEIQRVRFELGYNLLTVAAEPLVGVTQLFEQVVQQFTTAGASTTSTTAVTAASTPTLVTLTLASATGFAAGANIVVDVNARQESATVQSVSGSTISVPLTLAHSGTYAVTVEGGESIIRAILRKLQAIAGLGTGTGAIDGALAGAGVKKVDEIEFFGNANNERTRTESVLELQRYWRNELASALGVPNMREYRGGSSGNVSVY